MLHCLSCVTALKGEHATHCGEPDCSGVIDQLPGVIPRYRAAETNAGKNTLNLLSPPSSRRQGESSPFPQAKILNTGRDAAVMYFFLLVQIHALDSVSCCGKRSVEENIKAILGPASNEIQVKTETDTNQDHNRPEHCTSKTCGCTEIYLYSDPLCIPLNIKLILQTRS